MNRPRSGAVRQQTALCRCGSSKQKRETMAENCTIFCRVLNLDEIAQLLHSHFSSSSPTSNDSMTAYGGAVTLRCTRKVFRERGDDFCRLLLSMCAFVEGVSKADAVMKRRLVSHIESSELVLGVVAEPAFDADERCHAVVFAIAKSLDGIIFNGREIIDANGVALLAAT